MISDKINIPEPIKDIIGGLHPSERSLVAGVFALLEDDLWRDTEKKYFGLIHGEPTWAIAESRAQELRAFARQVFAAFATAVGA